MQINKFKIFINSMTMAQLILLSLSIIAILNNCPYSSGILFSPKLSTYIAQDYINTASYVESIMNVPT